MCFGCFCGYPRFSLKANSAFSHMTSEIESSDCRNCSGGLSWVGHPHQQTLRGAALAIAILCSLFEYHQKTGLRLCLLYYWLSWSHQQTARCSREYLRYWLFRRFMTRLIPGVASLRHNASKFLKSSDDKEGSWHITDCIFRGFYWK